MVAARIKEKQQIIAGNRNVGLERALNIVALSQAHIEELRRRRSTLLPLKEQARRLKRDLEKCDGQMEKILKQVKA